MDKQSHHPPSETNIEKHVCQDVGESIVISKVKNRIFRCKICRKRFRNHDQFLMHMRLHTVGSKRQVSYVHQGQNQRIFLCHFCDTKHLGLKSLLDHQNTEGACKFNLNKRKKGIQLEECRRRKKPKKANTAKSEISSSQQQHYVNVLSSLPQISSVVSSFVEVQGSGSTHQNQHQMQVPSSNILSSTDSISTSGPPQYHQENKQESKGNIVLRNVSKQRNEEVCNDDALQIEIPSHVKAIYLNSNNANYDDVMKQLEIVNAKLDVIMKHLENNAIAGSEGCVRSETLVASAANDTIEVQVSDAQSIGNETVIIEGFPPSYSMIQAAKEQQQQEYYALTLSSKQAQQLLKSETQILGASVSDLKSFQQKGKAIDLCQYISQLTGYSEQQQQQQQQQHQEQHPEQHQEQHQQHAEDQASSCDGDATESPVSSIPNHIIDKVYIESRSRANFAKNLTFAIFSVDERRGKNCTGRVFGKAQHKGQLDQIKLQAVKEATFRKYPCSSHLINMTWKKECITAIDSGLRNENRNSRSQNNSIQQQPSKNIEDTESKSEEK